MKNSPRYSAKARGHGRAYVAQHQTITGTHTHNHVHDGDETGLNGLFQGRGPGRLLIAVGMVVAGFCFTGWASIIFGGWHSRSAPSSNGDDFGAILGLTLPSGVQVGVVYFIGFGVGAVLMKLGGSMAKAGAAGASILGHFVATGLIIAAVVFLGILVLDGAPLSVLKPHFSG